MKNIKKYIVWQKPIFEENNGFVGQKTRSTDLRFAHACRVWENRPVLVLRKGTLMELCCELTCKSRLCWWAALPVANKAAIRCVFWPKCQFAWFRRSHRVWPERNRTSALGRCLTSRLDGPSRGRANAPALKRAVKNNCGYTECLKRSLTSFYANKQRL